MISLKAIWSALFDSLRDLLPIILVIGFFQLAVRAGRYRPDAVCAGP
jgi:hypothetical protein